jgi:hypothetical protein
LGRVVRPGVDPEWTQVDREYALAWTALKAATCATCGTRHDEWQDDRDAYEGATHYCRGDDVLAMQQESLPKGEDGRTMPGYRAYLKPTTRT